MKVIWQSTLIRVALVASVVAAFVLGALAIVLTSAPKGPHAQPDGLAPVAITLVSVSCTVILVFIAIFFRERESLSMDGRVPRCQGRCLLGVMLLVLFVVPMFHLGFALCAAALGWAALLLLPAERQLQVAAASDFLLSLALAESARRAGPAGDYPIAFVLLALQSLFPAALLPGLALLSSLGRRPRLARFAGVGYGAAALQAAALVLWAAGAQVADGVAPGEGVGCLRSVAMSPAGALLSLAERVEEPAPGPAPCQDALRVPCDSISFGALAFFVLLGGYVAAWVAVCTAGPFGSRVVPEGEDVPPGWCSASPRSRRQRAVLVGLGLGAVGIGLLGYFELPCPPSKEGAGTAVVSAASMAASGCTAVPAVPKPGCRCGESGDRGLQAFLAIPADQFGKLWCELGFWASMLIGLLLYVYHGFLCSLLLKSEAPTSSGSNEVAPCEPGDLAHPESPAGPSGPAPELRVVEYDASPLAPGGPGDPPGSARSRRGDLETALVVFGGPPAAPPGGPETALAIFRSAPKERRPLPSGEIGNQRVFAV